MNYIEINNLRINYERKGVGDNKIVFLHGNSCSLKYFNNQFKDANLFNNFELISFDFPGHGNSSHAADFDLYSIPAFANVLIELYKQLSIKSSILVGNSIGGNVILEAISELEGVKGIVLVGSSPFALPPAEDIYLPNPSLPLFFTSNLTDDDIKKATNIIFKDTAYFDFVFQEIKKVDSNTRGVWLQNFEKIIPKDEVEIVKSTDIPIAVIWGEGEEIMNSRYIKKVPFKKLWKNKLIIIPDSKHFPNVENSIVFNKYLFDFSNEQFYN